MSEDKSQKKGFFARLFTSSASKNSAPKSKKKKMKAQLIDMQGRVVLRSNLNEGINSLALGDLSPGIYTLQLEDGIGKGREFQVVKE